MLKRRSDLPLAKDPSSRFLPWLVAVMVFLACLALAGAMALNGVLERWSRDVSGTLTVQVQPAATQTETQIRVDRAVEIIRETPGVVQARALLRSQLVEMLEPWLGSGELLQDLPLPWLIDVTLEDGRTVDIEDLQRRLSAQVPGASVDDHRVWLSRLLHLVESLELLATAVVVLVGVATCVTVVYATRTGLAVHHSVIEVLHLVGARDDYIARQFAHHATRLGLGGGVLGVALALPTLAGIGYLARRIEGGFIPDLTLGPLQWTVLVSLPIASALLARMTARLTVHRALAGMP